MILPTTPLPWQGFDHVALATPDREATLHFYCEVLGMQAGEINDLGSLRSMVFLDNNRVMLEAIWLKE